jgi:hypothetical protein
MALLSHPSCRVAIPVVIVIRDGASGCFNVRPAELLANCTLDGRTYECAAASGPAQLIDLSDQLVVEFYVHSHVQNLTHCDPLMESPKTVAE